MTETACLRRAEEFVQTPETMRRSRRLKVLQDQLQFANRRAAGPFSHPFATRGSLSGLREQIRDVSRVADAAIVLTHKLRWHDGTANEAAELPQSARARMRRPHFATSNSPTAPLTLFGRDA